jgi:hypothetical protein
MAPENTATARRKPGKPVAALDMARAVSADHVIDFTTADFTRNRRAYDLIVDVAAHRPMSVVAGCAAGCDLGPWSPKFPAGSM